MPPKPTSMSQEDVQALRTQIDALKAPPTRSWAAIVADASKAESRENRRHSEKDKSCVRIRTRQPLIDSSSAEDDLNTFGRYLPTPTANTHIRTALLNAPPTQDAHVTGIGTTSIGYVFRFTDPESTETAKNETERLHKFGNDTKQEPFKRLWKINGLQERDLRIEDVARLKKRDNALGVFASIGIWFDLVEVAE